MTSQSCHSSYFFGVLCIILILNSGSITSLDTPTTLDCPYGRNGPPAACCVDTCNSNCGTECLRKGFQKGGQCWFPGGQDTCCCFISEAMVYHSYH
ncbi:unnamed protein product [Lathyrus oleraceus]